MTGGREGDAFWAFSCALYAEPGVEAVCLDLQDRIGLDVNLVLLACWLGGQGRAFDDRSFGRARRAVAAWTEEVVRPLRELRRRLKGRGADDVRERIKGAELEAERHAQMLLARAVPLEELGRAPAGEAITRNLAWISASIEAAPLARATLRIMKK